HRRDASQSPTRSSVDSRLRAPIHACRHRVWSLREHRSLRLDCGPLRRSVGLLAVAAALASAAPTGASLLPIRRTFGDLSVPRVRSGKLVIPAHHNDGRVRVIVGLPLASLAARYGRGLAAFGSTRKLDVSNPASRRYVARVDA